MRFALLDPVPLNSTFGLVLARNSDAGAVVSGDTLRLYLVLVGGGLSARKVLGNESRTISDGGYTVAFDQTLAWCRSHISEGVYRAYLYLNGTFDSAYTFEAFVEDGGDFNPDTDSVTT